MQALSIMVGAGMGRKKRDAVSAPHNGSQSTDKSQRAESVLEPSDIASLVQFFKLLHKLEATKRQR
jgi:hypothetical protein